MNRRPLSSLDGVLSGMSGLEAEDQLRLAQQALAQLRESVVITDTELDEPGPRIVYVNEAFTTMTGWKPEEVIGKSPRFLQGPKTTRQTLDRLRHRLTHGEAFEGEDINYRKDGSEFWIDWYIEPLHGRGGEVRYWVAVQRVMRELLENAGYRVRVAANCVEAIAATADFAPELVLLDLGMPDAAECATLCEKFSAVPMIGLSGLPADEVAGGPLSVGSILEKPFTSRQLLDVVYHALR